eukprot:662885-Ditylum_brightwellii.AAC.1
MPKQGAAPFKYPLFCITGMSVHLCPGVHAVPAATKSLAAHACKHKGGHTEGDPPPKPVWHRREQSGSATS